MSETGALLELIGGLVSGDGFAGLRSLLPSLATGTPQTARHRYDARLKKRGTREPNPTKERDVVNWTSHRQSLFSKNVTQLSSAAAKIRRCVQRYVGARINPPPWRELVRHSDVWKCRAN